MFHLFPQYIYTEGHYNKPFFTTYFKTSLLSIYLIAFVFWRPWQRLCCCRCGGVDRRIKGQRTECKGHYEEEETEGMVNSNVRLRRQQKEERRALLDEEDNGDDWGQKKNRKKSSGVKNGEIICVKVRGERGMV